MNIGKIADETGITAKTIRYYESIDLIPAAERQSNGYRSYTDNDVATLKFISRARTLGFSLEEVRGLLTLWYDKNRASSDVKALALIHIEEIETRIAELQSVKNTLLHLTARCQGNDRPDCPILEDLAQL
ncbi:MAG: Cu(I)-responsive transcriptional regulator [Rhodospirillaceae bacterium]|jgi:MerR family copper efflux transcriptional regulator|nr:Cu(I)-responsive transcriptional regulator [Rhodospirillaceae bacterium]MBT3909804.1 Cu(I)-responsive transcriptional regulator [Rhodospirillaceae bacterium]MBT5299064.1 Cu(I)-responsive transcriptional regulator [Rhodospirillaceae bacterium]MBT6085810.1 Cu(I)-responsive transcriptional regulator [Rhodospirillaceae bacterium]MBT6884588.1 Cu(I)-responsive transcriptional regulator [Rhodospirillaceae bacterium]